MNNIDSDVSEGDSDNNSYLDDKLLSREVLSRIDCFYRINTLKMHDKREITILWEVLVLYIEYLSKLLSLSVVLICVFRTV